MRSSFAESRFGDNVVIGAGSVVTKNCEANSVYAGNPAVRVCSLDDFYKKRKNAQIREACELAVEYYHCYGKYPPKEVFHEFFMLFADEAYARNEKWCIDKMKKCENFDESLNFISNNPPPFQNYESFLNYCFEYDSHSCIS